MEFDYGDLKTHKKTLHGILESNRYKSAAILVAFYDQCPPTERVPGYSATIVKKIIEDEAIWINILFLFAHWAANFQNLRDEIQLMEKEDGIEEILELLKENSLFEFARASVSRAVLCYNDECEKMLRSAIKQNFLESVRVIPLAATKESVNETKARAGLLFDDVNFWYATSYILEMLFSGVFL